MTAIHHMSLPRVLHALPRLFDGRIGTHPEVGTWRSAVLDIEAPAGAPIEADGELAGHAPARIGVLPRAIRIIVPV